jgi:hypothetical protein
LPCSILTDAAQLALPRSTTSAESPAANRRHSSMGPRSSATSAAIERSTLSGLVE